MEVIEFIFPDKLAFYLKKERERKKRRKLVFIHAAAFWALK